MRAIHLPLLSTFLGVITLIFALAQCASAQLPGADPLSRIGPRDFILDQAQLLNPEQRQEIKAVCEKLLDEKSIPIIVVTIRTMKEFPNRPQRIESFARTLFDEWGIGYSSEEMPSWNRGILLIVARNDRQARIELGEDWGRTADVECEFIMRDQMIPYFKAGNYAGGILAGVRGLETMCRVLRGPEGSGPRTRSGQGVVPGESDPQVPYSSSPRHPPNNNPFSGSGGVLYDAFVAIVIMLIIGAKILFAPLLGLLGYAIRGSGSGYDSGEGYYGRGYSTPMRRHSSGGFRSSSFGGSRSSSGGSRSSFGGGRSGGGGATGSW